MPNAVRSTSPIRKSVCPKTDAYTAGWDAGRAGRITIPPLYHDNPTLRRCLERGWWDGVGGQEPQPETDDKL